MNYKYEVGASFPCKLLRKGEAQSQVQSERGGKRARGLLEVGSSPAQQKHKNSLVLSSEERTADCTHLFSLCKSEEDLIFI